MNATDSVTGEKTQRGGLGGLLLENERVKGRGACGCLDFTAMRKDGSRKKLYFNIYAVRRAGFVRLSFQK